MFSRKIALLAAAYLAGNVVSSVYSSKKWKDVKIAASKAKESWESDKTVIIHNIIDTHKNFFEDVKEMLSEDNQKLLEKKKSQILWVVDSFKSEWDKLLKDVGGKTSSVTTRVQKLYDDKKDELRSHLQEVSPDEMKAVTDKLFTYFDSFMWKLKKETPKKVKVVAKKKTVKKPVAKKKSTTNKKTSTKKVASAKVEIKK